MLVAAAHPDRVQALVTVPAGRPRGAGGERRSDPGGPVGRRRFVIPDQGRYLAEHIPGAQYLELASGGHWPWAAPDADRFLDMLEEFLTGAPQAPGRDRVLATVALAP
jgi:hypothetical protein